MKKTDVQLVQSLKKQSEDSVTREKKRWMPMNLVPECCEVGKDFGVSGPLTANSNQNLLLNGRIHKRMTQIPLATLYRVEDFQLPKHHVAGHRAVIESS
jgi:hypothetical protein